jgi:predicted PurR-regulated permease PerM
MNLLKDIRMEQKWSRNSLVFFIALLLVAFAANFKMVAPYLLSVMMGSILAVLSYPAYRRLRGKKVGEKTSASLVTIGLTILVLGPLALFTLLAVKQGIAVGQQISQDGNLSFPSLVERIEQWRPLRALVDDPATLEKQISGGLQTGAKTASAALLGLAGNIPALLLQSVLALMTCFFMLMDGKAFVRWVMEKLPLDQDVQQALIKTFENTSVSVVLATLAAAAVQAFTLFVGYLALGVPGAFLAAGATFIFAWIPVVGSTPVWVVGAIYLYVQHSPGKMIAMVVIGLFTGVIDNFVRPLVLKGRGEMHPLVSLVAIFGGIEWFGIVGVFVGPILISILIALMEIWPTVARRSPDVSVPEENKAPPPTIAVTKRS